MSYPLTVSWFWLKRASDKRGLHFVVSTHPYSGIYLVRLGRKRWAIEGFFKIIKHRFGLHCFGQSTLTRCLPLADTVIYCLSKERIGLTNGRYPVSLIGKLPVMSALSVLFPSVFWFQLLRQIRIHDDIKAHHGFEIILKPLSHMAYQECCKI